MAAADIDVGFAADASNERGQQGGSTPSKPRDRPVKALDARSKPELYNIAKGLNINGRSTMTKEALLEAIRTTR
ncbi:hypothetical protein BH10PSE17_BH10PSE17_21560 [soil metagenome]